MKPKILVIDDIFGRSRSNKQRKSFCKTYKLKDSDNKNEDEQSENYVAEVKFYRGQTKKKTGDVVNDLVKTIKFIENAKKKSTNGLPFALILLDLCFLQGKENEHGIPEGKEGDKKPKEYFGLTLLREIDKHFPDIPIVVLSEKERKNVEYLMVQGGAKNFISRIPKAEKDKVNFELKKILFIHGLTPDEDGEFVGNSIGVLKSLREARNSILHKRSVLIYGEQGTGKEELAKYIARQTKKWDEITKSKAPEKKLYTLNMGALNPSLFSIELEGSVKKLGTTGAINRRGIIEEADKQILFLDELGESSVAHQCNLLRILQEKEIRRLGSSETTKVDVHFIFATNRSLDELLKKGFRSDLLARMPVKIKLPSLKERKEDIPSLTTRIVRKYEKLYDAKEREICENLLEKLQEYSWPGNIRELEHCIESAIIRYEGMQYLVEQHIEFTTSPVKHTNSSFENVLHKLKDFHFQVDSFENCEWKGQYEVIEEAFDDVRCNYLKLCLDQNVKPNGGVNMSKSVSDMTGKNYKTNEAGRFLKFLLGKSFTDENLVFAQECAARNITKQRTHE